MGTTDPPAGIGGRKRQATNGKALPKDLPQGHGARLSHALELGRHLERIHHELYVVVRATSPERSKPDSSDQRTWRLRIVQRCDAGGFDGPSPSRLHIRSDPTVLRPGNFERNVRVECPFAKSEEGVAENASAKRDRLRATKWFIYAHPSCADIVVIIC